MHLCTGTTCVQSVEYNENKKNLTVPNFTFVFVIVSGVPISGGDTTLFLDKDYRMWSQISFVCSLYM